LRGLFDAGVRSGWDYAQKREIKSSAVCCAAAPQRAPTL
jgi:hypothetical protein